MSSDASKHSAGPNHAANPPCLIGFDWGTSSFRASLLGKNGKILDAVASDNGILALERIRFATYAQSVIAQWDSEGTLPVIASGMITSKNGWCETPYLRTPCGVRDLASNLRRETVGLSTICFIPGLTTENLGMPDVIRGEETQLAGAAASADPATVFVLPGTHSKWAQLDNGNITHFSTYMTGELYAVIRKHTILGTFIPEAESAESSTEEAFERGVSTGLDRGQHLLNTLFSARTLALFDRLKHEHIADYLSGMLIGTELQSGLSQFGNTPTLAVQLIGNALISDRYRRAFQLAGITATEAPADIVSQGHWQIASLAGVIT